MQHERSALHDNLCRAQFKDPVISNYSDPSWVLIRVSIPCRGLPRRCAPTIVETGTNHSTGAALEENPRLQGATKVGPRPQN